MSLKDTQLADTISPPRTRTVQLRTSLRTGGQPGQTEGTNHAMNQANKNQMGTRITDAKSRTKMNMWRLVRTKSRPEINPETNMTMMILELVFDMDKIRSQEGQA